MAPAQLLNCPRAPLSGTLLSYGVLFCSLRKLISFALPYSSSWYSPALPNSFVHLPFYVYFLFVCFFLGFFFCYVLFSLFVLREMRWTAGAMLGHIVLVTKITQLVMLARTTPP